MRRAMCPACHGSGERFSERQVPTVCGRCLGRKTIEVHGRHWTCTCGTCHWCRAQHTKAQKRAATVQ